MKNTSALIGIILGALALRGQPPPEDKEKGAQGPAPPIKLVRLTDDDSRISVAFAPDGKSFASGGIDNRIRIWDVGTGKLRQKILAYNAPAGIARLAYFPDGKTLASAGWFGDGTLKLWEVATGKQLKVIGKNEGGIGYLAVSPDGNFVAWNGEAGKIHLYDVSAGKDARVLRLPLAVDSAAFSPDSKTLATANGNGKVRLWDVASGEVIRDIAAGQTTATGSQSIAFCKDGETLATASGQVKLWKVASGDGVVALGPKDEYAFCVAMSPDGRFVAGGTNRALRVWDMKTRKELYRWDEQAYSLAFSPDGRWLALGTYEGATAFVEIAKPAP